MVRGAAVVVALILVGSTAACGDDSDDGSTGTPGGGGGSGGEGGSGGSAPECDENAIPQPDGSCREVAVGAGIEPEACGAGFESDGARGCQAILAEDCAPGQMATPGETTCRAVLDCGPAPWGNLPPSGNLQYVDPTYLGGDSDGSAAKPWASLPAALAAAPPAATLVIAAGTYTGPFYVNDTVTLWGRCPELVTIDSADAVDPALVIQADDVTVRGVAITGAFTGLGLAEQLTGFVLSDSRIHDAGAEGAVLLSPATLTNVLVESAANNGLFVVDAAVSLEAVVVRASEYIGVVVTDGGTLSLHASVLEDNERVGILDDSSRVEIRESVVRDMVPKNGYGTAIHTQRNPGAAAPELLLEESVILRSWGVGIHVGGAEADIHGSVVRDTVPTGQGIGHGIEVIDDDGPASAEITSSVVSGAGKYGIAVADDSTVLLHQVIVRDVAPVPTAPGVERWGTGVAAFLTTGSTVAPSLAIESSLVERTTEVGVISLGASLRIDDSIISDTHRSASTGRFGRSLSVQSSTHGIVGELTLTGSILRRHDEVGVVVFGPLPVSIEGSLVSDAAGAPTDPIGWGIGLQANEMGAPMATVRGTRIMRAREAGIVLQGGSLTFADGAVSETAVGMMSAFGDGLVLSDAAVANDATVTGSDFLHNARAGLATFHGAIAISGSHIACNAVNLDVEALQADATVNDGGGNDCSCDGADGPEPKETQCKVLSSMLAPPTPLSP